MTRTTPEHHIEGRKPLMLWVGTFSESVFVTRAYRERGPGLFECTGQRDDITAQFHRIAAELGYVKPQVNDEMVGRAAQTFYDWKPEVEMLDEPRLRARIRATLEAVLKGGSLDAS